MKLTKLDHVAINVSNIQRSITWYVNNLNATVEHQDETWAMLNISGSKIALTISGQHPPHIAFNVENMEDVDYEKHFHRDGSEYCYIEDVDGNTIELISWENS